MKLAELAQLQEVGALHVKQLDSGKTTIGGVEVSPENAAIVLTNIGYIRYDCNPFDAVSKAERVISNFNKYIESNDFFNNYDVTFQTFRKTESIKYYDRITFSGPDYKFVVISGMPGLGGRYNLFDGSNGNRQPVSSFNGLKQLCEFIDSYFIGDDEETGEITLETSNT